MVKIEKYQTQIDNPNNPEIETEILSKGVISHLKWRWFAVGFVSGILLAGIIIAIAINV